MIAVANRTPQIRADLTVRDYLSYSAIRTYRQCPLRYYFKYVAGLPEETVAASLVFGSAIHRAVEFHFHELLCGNPPPTLDMLLGEYHFAGVKRDGREVSCGKGEDQDALTFIARRMLFAFQNSEIARPAGRVIGIEEELRGQVVAGLPDVFARLDLIVDAPDALVVTDFKTARSRWSQEQANDAGEQLLLYGELAKQLLPDKRIRLEFAVLTKTKCPSIERHVVHPTAQQVARTKKVVERVWRAIEAGVFYPAPSPLNCPTCPFRGPCRGWSG